MKQTVRAFIAAPVPAQVRQETWRAAQPLRDRLEGIRWTRPEGWHLTLHFLGEVPQGVRRSLTTILDHAAATEKPFRLRLDRWGSFPESGPARVLWIGTSAPVEPLARLHGRMARELDGRGFRVDRRPFHPHLTLGRVRRSRDGHAASEALETMDLEPIGSFEIDRIVLYRSELRPAGAVYTEIASAALAAEGASHGQGERERRRP